MRGLAVLPLVLFATAVMAEPAAAPSPRRIEMLGDAAQMTSPPGAKRIALRHDLNLVPCVDHPEQSCELRRFAWQQRPDEDEIWEALKIVPARTPDLIASCDVQAQALAGCRLRAADDQAVPTKVVESMQALLADFRLPPRDLSDAKMDGARMEIPFRWVALKSALDGGPGSRPVIPAVVKPFDAQWAGSPAGPYRPDRAYRFGVRGVAVLDCNAARDGALSDCLLANQYPMGFGFGDAALRMATSHVISIPPQRVDGERVWVRQTF